MRRAGIVYALAGLFALCVPILGIYPIFMMKLLCFAMFACAFNLLLGFSGMLSFGHAAFFGTAAYATGWLVTAHGWGTVPAILGGIIVAAALGFGIGLIAIRDNESRAISLGYDINRYKLLAFVLSATLSGLAGSLKTLVLGFTTLSDVLQANSGEVILMTLLGGSGTFFGPVIGAALVVTLQEYLSDIVGGWVTVIIGGVFVACVLAFRRGIVGELAALRF